MTLSIYHQWDQVLALRHQALYSERLADQALDPRNQDLDLHRRHQVLDFAAVNSSTTQFPVTKIFFSDLLSGLETQDK